MRYQHTISLDADDAFSKVRTRFEHVTSLEPNDPHFTLDTRAYSGDGLVAVDSLTSGHKIDNQLNDSLMVAMIKRGRITAQTRQNEVFNAMQNDIFIAAKPHKCLIDAGHFLSFSLDQKRFTSISRALGIKNFPGPDHGIFILQPKDRPGIRIANIFELMQSAFNEDLPKQLAIQRLHKVVDLFVWEFGQINDNFNNQQASHKILKKCKEYIRANAAEITSMSDVANTLGVSLRSLQLAFKAFDGVRPSDFLRQCRLGIARQELMMANSSSTVADIAFLAGFSSLNTFNRQYKSHFGELPSSTRKQTRN